MPQIVLPIGEDKFRVGDIPRMLSEAIHPDPTEPEERTLKHFDKGADGHLTDEDVQALIRCWAKLPPLLARLAESQWELVRDLPESEWPPYQSAVNAACKELGFALEPIWRNPELNREIQKISTEKQHWDLLKSAIYRGEVAPFNDSYVPVPNAIGEQLENAFISRDDLQKYVWGLNPCFEIVCDVQQRVAQQEEHKCLEGRYTLENASKVLQSAGARYESILEKLKSAAVSGELPVYAPGSLERYVFGDLPNGAPLVRGFYEEAYWFDLNTWLSMNEPRLFEVFQFPRPANSGTDDHLAFKYELPLYSRLRPRTPRFTGGRITETDKLTLDEAARMASRHSGDDVTPRDFLRAAARGEIELLAKAPRAVMMQPCRESDGPFPIQEDSFPVLPLHACKSLSTSGVALWRTIEQLEAVDELGVMGRYVRYFVPDNEPDIKTAIDNCVVLGCDVHALADTFIDDQESDTQPQQSPDKGKGVQREQEMVIIKKLKELGFSPLTLPAFDPKIKPDVKSQCWESLRQNKLFGLEGRGKFDKAWDRLSQFGELKRMSC